VHCTVVGSYRLVAPQAAQLAILQGLQAVGGTIAAVDVFEVEVAADPTIITN
jgi:hypothetical protein